MLALEFHTSSRSFSYFFPGCYDFSLNNVYVEGSSISFLREQVSGQLRAKSVARASRPQALDPQTVDPQSSKWLAGAETVSRLS